jgi:para-nitrobenzyl esterase
MQRLLIAATALFLFGCANKAPEINVPPTSSLETATMITQGELVGFIEENGAHVWRGVPFGADTSGENRWRAPHPAPSWDGVRTATKFAPVCAQIATAFTPIEGWVNGRLEGSENCLAVDIYAPADAKGRALPVMLWIHGGSNVSGASQLYLGDRLAVHEDVIVVSVQYRLGPLGWFSHDALRESAEHPHDAAANFGILDLIASLKWVGDNISAFGGDPENITIFGESAGGHNVTTLLASPLANGLFHRAIIQSGSFDSVSIPEAQGVSGDQPNPSKSVTERLGGSHKFRTASTQEVFDAFELDGGGYMELPTVIQDGVTIPETPLRDVFASSESFNTVPVMTGINKDEMKLFYLLDPKMTKKSLGFLYVARDQGLYDAASDYTSRLWRLRSVDLPAAMMAEAGHDNVYAYQFDWDEGGRVLWMDFSKMLGAAHGLEIPFVFNRFKILGDADKVLFKKKTLKSRDALSRDMGRYWAAFARDGVPAPDGLADWPVYGTDGQVMHFDSTRDKGVNLRNGGESMTAIIADLKTDTRVNPTQKCEIAVGIGKWMTEYRDQLLDGIGCQSKETPI